jgi:hypothetical protein
MTPEFIATYSPLLDGVLFPYRHESGGANLTDASLVEAEVIAIRKMAGKDFPICDDVYATAHSRLGASTAQYVEQVMAFGHGSADGVMVYCHQDPQKNAEKYAVIKRLFTQWAKPGEAQ